MLLDHQERCAELGTRLRVAGGRVVTRVVAVTGLAQVILVVPAVQDSTDPTVTASTVDPTYRQPPAAAC